MAKFQTIAFIALIATFTGTALAQPDTAAPAASPTMAQPSVVPVAPQAQAVTAKDLKIGAPVIAADGSKIGEISRISASSSGDVTEVRDTLGEKAGLDAKTFAVAPGQITVTGGGTLSVSLTPDDARKAAETQNSG